MVKSHSLNTVYHFALRQRNWKFRIVIRVVIDKVLNNDTMFYYLYILTLILLTWKIW